MIYDGCCNGLLEQWSSCSKEPNYQPIGDCKCVNDMNFFFNRFDHSSRSLSHRKKAGSTVRNMCFDFSSAFGAIQPTLLRDRLERKGVDTSIRPWILDYLTN